MAIQNLELFGAGEDDGASKGMFVGSLATGDGSGLGSDSSQQSGGDYIEGRVSAGRDFSNWNREIRDQICPDTQKRIMLLTKKQLADLRLKELKGFGE